MTSVDVAITRERDRVIGLLNTALLLMKVGDPYYADMIEAIKMCVRNDELHMDDAIRKEREFQTARRGY